MFNPVTTRSGPINEQATPYHWQDRSTVHDMFQDKTAAARPSKPAFVDV